MDALMQSELHCIQSVDLISSSIPWEAPCSTWATERLTGINYSVQNIVFEF